MAVRTPSYVYHDKKAKKYYSYITYNKKVYRRPRRNNRDEAVRDAEDIKREIEEVKASEQPKYAKDFKPYKDPAHPYLINVTNTHKEVVTQAAVSEGDYGRVKAHKWHLSDGYAQGYVNRNLVRMHHFILGKPEDGYVVDHIDSTRLNNIRSNLRHATRSQNSQNARKKGKNTYIGVQYTKGKYQATHSTIYLGVFVNEEDAARMYDIYAFQNGGPCSLTNGLITYEKAMRVKITIPSSIPKKVRDLPDYIHRAGKKFRCSFTNNAQQHWSPRLDTLEEAIEELSKMKAIVDEQNISKRKRIQITRNKDNQVVILTTKGDEILVDEDLWYKLSEYKWYTDNGYVKGYVDGANIRMHRFVMYLKTGESIPKGLIVDHINNVRSDNRAENLRIASYSLNNHNRRKWGARSKYVGVTKDNSRYLSNIKKNGEKHYLGTFPTEREAAIAYNNKAMELHGKNAKLNIIEDE